MIARHVLSLVLPLGLLASCNTRPLDCPAMGSIVEVQRFYPQTLDTDVDLLFVVDNSNSMEDEQVKLASQFSKLIDALRTPKLGKDRPEGPECTEQDRRNCKIPNIRVGVVSSDLGAGTYGINSCERAGGDGGRLQTTPRQTGCTPPRDPWISYTNGVTNVPGTGTDPIAQVKDAFTCIATLGTGGCGFEHQLEAARRALDPKVNPGFLRPDAYLAVVFITDEDDCSAARPELFDPAQRGVTDPLGPLTSFRCAEFGLLCDQRAWRQPGPRTNCQPAGAWLRRVDDYVAFFRAVKPHDRTLLFAIAGPTGPVEVGLDGTDPALKASCRGSLPEPTNAAPALRIASVVQSMGTARGFFNRGVDDSGREVDVNICSPDFGPALKKVGDVIVATLTDQCMPAPVLTGRGDLACRTGDLVDSQRCASNSLAMADCIVEEVVGDGKGASITRCPAELFDAGARSCGSACPCWRLVPKAECQKRFGTPYSIEILRESFREPVKGTMAAVRCASTITSAELSAAPPKCR